MYTFLKSFSFFLFSFLKKPWIYLEKWIKKSTRRLQTNDFKHFPINFFFFNDHCFCIFKSFHQIFWGKKNAKMTKITVRSILQANEWLETKLTKKRNKKTKKIKLIASVLINLSLSDAWTQTQLKRPQLWPSPNSSGWTQNDQFAAQIPSNNPSL